MLYKTAGYEFFIISNLAKLVKYRQYYAELSEVL